MLNKEITEMLNNQISQEFYSAYLYLDIANYYMDAGLSGFGNWFKIQAQEERDHAMLFIQYLQNNGEKVKLNSINAPEREYKNVEEPLHFTLTHEQYVTALINKLYDNAHQNKDFRTMQFLDWFVKEQGEEEKSADDLIKKMGLFGGDAKALYMLDSELGARTYSAPSLVL